MRVSNACPGCGSIRFKKHGHNRHGKQNHHGKVCCCQFVTDATDRIIARAQRTLVERLWCERLSLRGMCRAVGVSLTRLLPFMAEGLAACPDHFHV